ncbi:hypothetical protein M434DRAFT_220414 [Hypoxylon sp. CO27-5]|nr:hypothetical protein M434DRAFT_220414 [Hypoxylon sp. CO27-5]
MNKFPTETLSSICSFLSKTDMQRFRLVCRRFSEVGAEYVRSSMSIFMIKKDLSKLYSFSTNTRLARGLRELEYTTVTMLPPSELHRRIPARYRQYKSLAQEQDDILTTHYDYMCFLSTFPRFPRLREITLYMDHRWWYHLDDLSKKYKDCRGRFPIGTLLTARAGSHHLQMLFSVLAETRLKINFLTINGLDWHFFDQNDTKLKALFQPLVNLKYLDLKFDNNYIPDLNGESESESVIENDNAVQDYNSCRELMSTGVLGRCLQTLPNLDTLKLSFKEFWCYDSRNFRGAPLNAIVPPGFTWTYLNTLELMCIDCERQDLMKLLLRHKETLRELCLVEIVLRNTSWIILLDDIRRELYLTFAYIKGPIRGHFESHEEGHGAQNWVLRHNLLDLVPPYIIAGGEMYPELQTCPLSAANSQPIIGYWD